MERHAFFLDGDRLLLIANPCGAALVYHAREIILPPGIQSAIQHHKSAQTIITVAQGSVEIMVNGTSSIPAREQILRIAPGLHFAWRNAGPCLARLLVRTAPSTPPPASRCRITMSTTS